MMKKKGRHHKGKAEMHEPPPAKNKNGVVVLDLVMNDIRAGKINIAADCLAGVLTDLERRSKEGEKKYGTQLHTNNGRDALIDFYQEILDAIVYIRQFNAEWPDETFSQHLYYMVWDIAGVTFDEINK